MFDYIVRPIIDRTMFTGRHRDSPFASTWSQTEELLDRELRALKARDVVFEIDVHDHDLRVDGRLRATARPATPAIRIAFETPDGPMVYATDRFWTWQDNARAIALGLEALRRIERYGIADRAEQYAGFKQLGAGRAMPASHMTRDAAVEILDRYTDRDWSARDADDLAHVFRLARRATHPDRVGDRSEWDRVEEAGKLLGVVSS